MSKPIRNVVSVSGGKDSTALILYALEHCKDPLFVFADTGHEHPLVYEYMDYLERTLVITIQRVKKDFSDRFPKRRMMIARDIRHKRVYPTEPVFDAMGNPVPKRDGRGRIVYDINGKVVQKTRKVGGGRKKRWTNKAKRRALSVMHPTGLPFLDICLLKGRFPSAKVRFCTDEIKLKPIREQVIEPLLKAGYLRRDIISWQGVRAEESKSRAKLPMEEFGDDCLIYRPLLNWTAEEVFNYHHQNGIEPNPLYKQGMGRVGCMPCIMCRKEELAEIAKRFPEEIDRVRRWEQLVKMASKRGFATMFTLKNTSKAQVKKMTDAEIYDSARIDNAVAWAGTDRGGKQLPFDFNESPVSGCSSIYGLCE